MKQLFFTAVAVLFCSSIYAQAVDLSKVPGQGNEVKLNKSNAQLLQESQAGDAAQMADAELAEKYKADVKTPSGASRVFVPATTTPGVTNQGGMMNSTSTQQSIGNLKTNSTLIYDDAGKVRGNSTTIKLGNK